MTNAPEIIRADALDGVPHGFLTGIGQQGEPDPEFVLPGGQLVLLDQVHSAAAILVDAPFPEEARPQADGCVTKTAGLVLGIRTADCAPVLFADTAAGVIGAAHAGWRGAHFGVIEATVRRMEELGATRQNICASVGPTIAQENYEVGWDFREQFEERHGAFFTRGKPGKWLFDLPGYVQWRLETLKIGKVEVLGIDTYAEEARFYSYRRSTHRGEVRDGRQYALIALS